MLRLNERVLGSLWPFFLFSLFYVFLAWTICGTEKWWVFDFYNGFNVFSGDDAYRFFLARSAWSTPELYTYSFDMPINLVLEGVVTTLTEGDLFWTRFVHALLAAGSLSLVWASGLKLGISPFIMLLAVLVMGLNPLYALVSLSFYGEFWVGFFLTLLIWFFVNKQLLFVAILASLMPLIRAESVLFLAPLWLWMLKQKHYRFAILIVLPGLFYVAYIWFSLNNFSDYYQWRFELRRVFGLVSFSRDWQLTLSTFSLFLTLPAILGWLHPPIRSLYPLIVGAGIWAVFIQALIIIGNADYEPRYHFVLIPVLVLLWAGCMTWLSRLRFFTKAVADAAVILVSLVAITLNLSRLDLINKSYHGVGATGFVSAALSGSLGEHFFYYKPENIRSAKMMASKIHEVLSEDGSINRLAIFNTMLFYFLDPKNIGQDVQVDYPTNNYLFFHLAMDGEIFTQHPGGKMFSFITLGKPDFLPGENRLLYADRMPMPTYPHRWEIGNHQLYLLSYNESLESTSDLDRQGVIDPEAMKHVYAEVFCKAPEKCLDIVKGE